MALQHHQRTVCCHHCLILSSTGFSSFCSRVCPVPLSLFQNSFFLFLFPPFLFLFLLVAITAVVVIVIVGVVVGVVVVGGDTKVVAVAVSQSALVSSSGGHFVSFHDVTAVTLSCWLDLGIYLVGWIEVSK